jgi:hypothetical protein
MSRADGFINANSAAPISPTVRALNTMWIEITSAVRNSSSFDTSRAPAAVAMSDVRFWLQAMTFMPREPDLRDPRPNVSKSEDAEGFSRQIVAEGVLPTAATHRRSFGRDMTGTR